MENINNTSLISVVIPCYKVEKYLRGCLDSLLAQTYMNWEGIIVNDGSPDHSKEIAEEYVCRDTRFVLINKPNGGVSSARNAGLSKCSGNYVFFFDSDDLLHPKAFEFLLKTAEDTGCDITASWFRYTENPEYYLNESINLTSYSVSINPLKDILCGTFYWDANFVWGRLYKYDIIKGMSFAEQLRMHEDTFWDIEALSRSSKVAHLPLPLYLYRNNPASMMHTSKIIDEIDSAFFNCSQAHELMIRKSQYLPFADALYTRCGLDGLWLRLKIVLMTGNAEQVVLAKKIFRYAHTHGWYDLWKEKLTRSSRFALNWGVSPVVSFIPRMLWKIKYSTAQQ